MATVRCKFRCESKTERLEYGSGGRLLYDFEMSAVSDGSEENKKFFQYTPSGTLKVSSVKIDTFEVGKEYYLDIIPA